MPATPDPLREWLDLIRCDARSPPVAAVLDRHGASLDKAAWIHGAAGLALRDSGVYLILWKPGSGKAAAIEVVGVEFSFSGMRGGKAYAGPVPFGMAGGDTIDQMRAKLAPLPVEIWREGKSASAHDETRRYSATFDARGRLTRFAVIGQFEMRRIPRA